MSALGNLPHVSGWMVINLMSLSSTDQLVTSDHMSVVARCCSDKWKAMGRVLLECDSTEVLDVVSGLHPTDPNSEKLRLIIEVWLKRNTVKATWTVNQLIAACGHPDVNCQGVVIRELQEQALL